MWMCLMPNKKYLLVYDGPHPDIAAIRQSIENDKNYEVKVSQLYRRSDRLNPVIIAWSSFARCLLQATELFKAC